MKGNKSVEDLMKRAFDAIEEFDYRRAIDLGEKLQRLHHTSSFEILALAYAGQGQTRRAVEVLQEGVQNGPKVWVLWQLLGNYQSDLKDFDAALSSYATALDCPNVWASSVHLNVSVALSRAGRFDDALRELNQMQADELETQAEAHRLYIFNCQGHHAEVITQGRNSLSRLGFETLMNLREQKAEADIVVEIGYAHWLGMGDRKSALWHAWFVVQGPRTPARALALIREVDGMYSPNARYFRLLIEGTSTMQGENDEFLGFFITYDVVADRPDKALEFVRPFEDEEVRAGLCICECEDIEARPRDPKGVYRLTGHYFFPRDDEEC